VVMLPPAQPSHRINTGRKAGVPAPSQTPTLLPRRTSNLDSNRDQRAKIGLILFIA